MRQINVLKCNGYLIPYKRTRKEVRIGRKVCYTTISSEVILEARSHNLIFKRVLILFKQTYKPCSNIGRHMNQTLLIIEKQKDLCYDMQQIEH